MLSTLARILAIMGLLGATIPVAAKGDQGDSRWRFLERKTYTCDIYYDAPNEPDFSVGVSRTGLSFGLEFREGGEWFKGKDWFDRKHRVYIRKIIFERSPEDPDEFLSTYPVDTSSMKGPDEERYTAFISSSAALNGYKRIRGSWRLTQYEKDFLRRLATQDYLDVAGEYSDGRVTSYRVAMPRGMEHQIQKLRECAAKFPEGS